MTTSTMSIRLNAILRIIAGFLVFAILLLLPAGTLRYWEVWVFLGVWFIPGIFFVLYFCKHDPALLERRMRRREKQKEQMLIMAAFYLLFLPGFVLPGLDHRLGWSSRWVAAVPLWLKLTSLALVLAGYLTTIWVFVVNRHASATIVVEPDQKVISNGPYRWVRHPMYFGVLIMMLSTPLGLGSYVAVPVFALIIPILILRLLNEEKVLRRDLPGYTEYCERTRHRLIPGVW